jgi:hypothetical protein
MLRTLSLALSITLCVVSSAAAQTHVTAQLAATPDGVHEALAELKREPNVRNVQEAALEYFRVNQDQIDSMRSRARLKALAPVLEVSGGYTKSELDDVNFNAAEGFGVQSFQDGLTEPWIIRGSGGMGWNIRGKATINLPRLIFNPEELDVASLAGLVEGILKESTRLYYMRRRLQVDMILKPPTDQATMLSKQLRIEELTAMLDAMTGGWYQTALDVAAGRIPAEEAARQPAGSTTAGSNALPPHAPATVPTSRGLSFTPAAVGR